MANGASGVNVAGPSNTIGGDAAGAHNLISGNRGDGIRIAAAGNAVQGNFIGTDFTGSFALPNAGSGVSVGASNNLIGGTAPGARNIISGNTMFGVAVMQPSANLVQGNFIGTDASGQFAVGNGFGVLLNGAATLGGTAAGAGNLIAGNRADGVQLAGLNNVVQGNRIGTDLTGTLALPNNGNGVQIATGSNDLIGGTAAGAGNLIAGNRQDGVNIVPGFGNQIQGNYIGTDITGTRALGNARNGIVVSSPNNTIGGTAPGSRNVISGNAMFGILVDSGSDNLILGNFIGTDVVGTLALPNDGSGVSISANSNTVGGAAAGAGNLISGNRPDGIRITGNNNVVQGNRIGADVSGGLALPNSRYGVQIEGSNNLVGGTLAGAGNLVSANATVGIYIITGMNNRILGNLVGTDLTGAHALGNGGSGVVVSSPNNTIGGTIPGSRNVISGNRQNGILITSGNNNLVEGNFIGSDASGESAVSNTTGLTLGTNFNTIGGTVTGAGNLISGNSLDGVAIQGFGNLIQGNFVGTNAEGTAPLPNAGSGFRFDSGGATIGGTSPSARNIISSNGAGISASGGSVILTGNYIGTDVSGEVALGNGYGAVFYNAASFTIGGTAAGAGNLISASTRDGIEVQLAASGLIQGNLIGTDASGTRPLGNFIGISVTSYNGAIIGGASPGAGNVIAGNETGIFISNGPAVIQGNRIGTDTTGSIAVGNHTGIYVLGQLNLTVTIGGTVAAARNIISANTTYGMRITSNGLHVLTQGNYIGTNAAGSAPLGNDYGIDVNGPGLTIGGIGAGAGNLISGNTSSGIVVRDLESTNDSIQGNYIGTDALGTSAIGNGTGISVTGGASNIFIGGNSVTARNLISGNHEAGIFIDRVSPRVVIAGNFIGTDSAGANPVGNGTGVRIDGAATTVGGTDAEAGNLISGNMGSGVAIQGSENQLQGNLIGTDVTGTLEVGNLLYGVALAGRQNTIGGTVAAARNVISGNFQGIQDQAGGNANLIQGNYIGTDVTGTSSVGRHQIIGITNVGADTGFNTIGGTQPGAGNLISGNLFNGLVLSVGYLVQGNYIGTDATGTLPVPNGDGITIIGNDNTIGGTAPGAGNVIAGNSGNGIRIRFLDSTGNVIQGNAIGTDSGGTIALPNGANGVFLDQARNNTIGGTAAGAGNVIAFNGNDGVLVDTGTGNAILRNRIFGHDNGLGIELANGGNHDQAAPTLTSAATDGQTTTIEGTLTSAPNTTFTLELFVNAVCNPSGYGEGERFIASFTVATDADGNATFSLTVAIALDPGQFIAATATDPDNNTSAFSACAEITDAGSPGLLNPINELLWIPRTDWLPAFTDHDGISAAADHLPTASPQDPSAAAPPLSVRNGKVSPPLALAVDLLFSGQENSQPPFDQTMSALVSTLTDAVSR